DLRNVKVGEARCHVLRRPMNLVDSIGAPELAVVVEDEVVCRGFPATRQSQLHDAANRSTTASRRSNTTPSSAAAASMNSSSIAIRWPRPMHSGCIVIVRRPPGAWIQAYWS